MYVLASFFALFLGHFIAPFISLCDTFIFKAPRDLALIWKKEARKKNSNLSCRISLSLYVFYPKNVGT